MGQYIDKRKVLLNYDILRQADIHKNIRKARKVEILFDVLLITGFSKINIVSNIAAI
jgi:hypothetical protein